MVIHLTKNYRIHPFSNGQGRGLGRFLSLLDFFFPYKKNGKFCHIRAEASAPDLFGKVRQRDYFTFRAFAWDFWYEFVVNPIRDFRKNATEFAVKVGLNPKFAYKVGAIAFDTAVYIIDTGSTPQSASYTCTGTNRYLTVGGLADITSATITSISYNSVNMTAIASQRKTAGNTYLIGLYGQGNPASGSNTVTQTNSSGLVRTTASSYSGAQQTDAADSSNTGENTSATGLTVSTTTVADNCWVIALFFNNDIGTKTAGSNTTKRAAFVQDIGGTSQGCITDSNAAQTPAGSKSQTADDGLTSQDWVAVIMSIAPAAGAASSSVFAPISNLLTLGVG